MTVAGRADKADAVRAKFAHSAAHLITYSRALASFHSASISASVASCGTLPRAASAVLDRRKAALEFPVGLPQQRFRIGVKVARKIDGGEQQIADFGRRVGIVAVERRLDLVGFFANFA